MNGGNALSFVLGLLVIVLLCVIGAFSYVVLSDPIPRYERFPALDSRQSNGVFAIECKGYANRPDFDINAQLDKSMIGFEAVSVCRTVAP